METTKYTRRILDVTAFVPRSDKDVPAWAWANLWYFKGMNLVKHQAYYQLSPASLRRLAYIAFNHSTRTTPGLDGDSISWEATLPAHIEENR